MACVTLRTLIRTCVLTLRAQVQTSVQMAQEEATIDTIVALIKANRGQIKHLEFKSSTLQKPRQNLWRSSTSRTWNNSTTKQAAALLLRHMEEPAQWLNKPCLSQRLTPSLQLLHPNEAMRSRNKLRNSRIKLRGSLHSPNQLPVSWIVVCTERRKALHQRFTNRTLSKTLAPRTVTLSIGL